MVVGEVKDMFTWLGSQVTCAGDGNSLLCCWTFISYQWCLKMKEKKPFQNSKEESY